MNADEDRRQKIAWNLALFLYSRVFAVRCFPVWRERVNSRDEESAESGFTLLEIMLVIVIMAVTSMMVAPSYFSAISVSVDDEGKRLAQVLRLASEEATLSGDAFRIRFRQHSYAFQSAGASGVWQPLQQSPYQQHKLAKGIQLVEIRPSTPLTEQVEKEDKHAEVVLADIVLAPDGIMKIADIIMDAEPPGDYPLTIQLRSGPGGIAVKKDDHSK